MVGTYRVPLVTAIDGAGFREPGGCSRALYRCRLTADQLGDGAAQLLEFRRLAEHAIDIGRQLAFVEQTLPPAREQDDGHVRCRSLDGFGHLSTIHAWH